MKRLGLFTGTVYPDDCDLSKVTECCLQLSEKQADDKAFIEQERIKNLAKCIGCMGCPTAQRSKV